MVNAFSPGQLVLLKDMHTGKLDQRFPDLCIVIRKLHNNQYLIQRHKDNYRRKANVAQLKPFLSRTNSIQDRYTTQGTQTMGTSETLHSSNYFDPIESDSDSDIFDDIHSNIDLPASSENYLLPPLTPQTEQ